MPDCDGIDLLEELQGIMTATRFALYTGWGDDAHMIARALDAGADAVFRKDLSPARLLDELAVLCAPRAASPTPVRDAQRPTS